MLDRTIPFYNTILRCDRFISQEYVLPDGFEIVGYRAGDERSWAKLEFDIGDFESIQKAEEYFTSNYLSESERLQNILFLMNPEKCVIGSCIAWQDRRNDTTVASLHWLVVDEAYQGRGLGRALCLAAMNRFAEQGEFPVYIHTQPWSWKAILLYLSIGFRIQKEDTFSHYENQFEKAMEVLHGVVEERFFEIMKKSVESNMTVYDSNAVITVRSMVTSDIQIVYHTYLSYGWHPNLETYETYYREQEENTRKVFIAEYRGEVAGICTLVMNPTEGPFAGTGVPEIVDLCVFFHLHKLGIGNRLLDAAEREAFKVSDAVYLAVGVHSGYGAAQRIYVKRGYNFDGSGVWYQGKQLEQYALCKNDDDLLLYMSKKKTIID